MSAELICLRPEGLYCAAGDFYIDPSRSVARAVITHAHGDHAHRGCGRYWGAAPGKGLLKIRLGRHANIRGVPYGEAFTLGAAQVSLHPAGHVLGSAQVRIEVAGEVWVVSGDYKREPDPSCAPFEPVRCDTFITEATFAAPQYRWPPVDTVIAELLDWWQDCREQQRSAVLFCYALGKAQRVLAELARHCESPAYLHASMLRLVAAYRRAGVTMLPGIPVANQARDFDWRGALVLAPPGARGTPWMRRFARPSCGFVSGWMGGEAAARRGYDRGFTLSDHADWNGLIRSIEESGARRVLAMHGQTGTLVDYLRQRGWDAAPLNAAPDSPRA